MEEKASRLQSAYGELLKRKLASTKKDIAERMGASAPNVSSAFNGDPRVLTDRFLSRFNAAYGNIFSMDWLLNGKGEMLEGSVVQTSYGDHSPNLNGNGNSISDSASLERAFDTIDKALEEIAAQRKLVERSLALLEKRDAQLDRLIELLQTQILK